MVKLPMMQQGRIPLPKSQLVPNKVTLKMGSSSLMPGIAYITGALRAKRGEPAFCEKRETRGGKK